MLSMHAVIIHYLILQLTKLFLGSTIPGAIAALKAGSEIHNPIVLTDLSVTKSNKAPNLLPIIIGRGTFEK